MERRIYLVRHAQAVAASFNLSDELRTLMPEGEVIAKQVGQFLRQKKSNLNLIITSHATRAYVTALHISKELNQPVEIRIEKILYSEDKVEILRLLTALPDSYAAVMLVGHYPTVVELQNYLASNKQLTSMNTGELIELRFTNNWAMLSGGMATHEYSFHPSQHA